MKKKWIGKEGVTSTPALAIDAIIGEEEQNERQMGGKLNDK